MSIIISLFLVVLSSFPFLSYAQDIELSAEAFGTLPELTNVRISPDGSKLLMLQNIDGQLIITTRSLEDLSEPMYGLPFDKGRYAWAEWLTNEEILAGLSYTERYKGGDLFNSAFGMVSVDWKGEKATLIADPNVDYRDIIPLYDLRVIDIMKDDPDHILVQVVGDGNPERGWKRDVYKRNIRTQDMEIYHQGVRTIKRWVSDKDHNIRLGFGVPRGLSIMEARDIAHYRKDVNSDWIELYDYNIRYGSGVTRDDREEAPYRVISLSSNPSELFVTKANQYGKQALYIYNVDSEKFVSEIASNDKYDLENFVFDDQYNLESYKFEGERPTIVHVGERGEKLNNIFAQTFPGSTVEIESQSKDKNRMIIRVTSPTDPGTFYFYDENQKKIEMIGYIYQKVDLEKLSPMTPIEYKARDGLIIPGYLSLPHGVGEKNLPTIILPHGGPLTRDNWRFDFWVQFLTTQGYAVLQMNYRGSTGYGEDYMEKGFHEWGRKMVEDINDGAKWMISQGYADPNKMCIVGASYGGYAALQTVVKDETLYKCSVAFAPVTDLSMEFRNINTTFIESKEWTYDEASPSNHINKFNIPILMFHGDLDENVDVKNTRTFNNKMERAGKDIKYIEFENENHFLLNQEYRIRFLRELGHFLEKHLKD